MTATTKNIMHRIIAAVSSSAILCTTVFTVNMSDVFSEDPQKLPASLDAPDIILYDQGDRNTDMVVSALTPVSVLDFYEKAYTNSYEKDGETLSDYGKWYFDSRSGIQVDWKIDDGQWQYQPEWDESIYSSGDYTWQTIDGKPVTDISVGSASEWSRNGIAGDLENLGCLLSTTDGSDTFYRFDTENHIVSVRARYLIRAGSDSEEPKYIFSDWSETALYGKGNRTDSTAASDLSAPVIKNLKIDGTNSNKSPFTSFDVYPEEDVAKTFMWSEQYDSDFEYSRTSLIVEASTDPEFGEGATIIDDSYNTPKRHLEYGYMFHDIWWELPSSNRQAFCWNGETVYLRAKWKNTRTVSGQDSSIESPYSNILSVKGPVIGTYDVTVTHEPFGFETAYSGYSKSYTITEGREYEEIHCTPVEGCYVDTVKVNGTVMYDHDDESTYELLDRWNYDKSFAFREEDRFAAKDLDIVIAYGGTPTATFGISTEHGTGGYITTSSSYKSWDDNSLVVFYGTAPEMTIHTYSGYEIDKVMIDGTENTEARTDASYTFPAVTDNTHSISVTFKRIAYEVDSSAYHGTITTDYPGYSDDDFVKTGDDITFTYMPDRDENGNSYQIEAVYIDGVVNEEAKTAGSHTFKNIQADHTIRVIYSDDPVITHDITATSGENGTISPEDVVHVKEGSDQRFDFNPDPGYETDKVTVDGKEIKNLSTKDYYFIADTAEDHTINVTFKKIPVKYSVNVIVSGSNPSVHTVNPAGTTPLQEGDDFTVTYSPFTGYEVEKVLVNGSEVQADGSYSIRNIKADCTIEIFFRIKNYTVTFTDYDGTILKKETVEYGKTVKAPDTPVREHYVFDGWDSDYSNITANVTVRATYTAESYTVKFISWDGTELKTETVEYTRDAAAPVPPEREGYDFSMWSHDYTNVGSDLTVTAIYKQKQYTVTFVDSDDTVISTQTVNYGEAAAAPVPPEKKGFRFAGWDSTDYGAVTQNMTIKAKYTEELIAAYTITSRALGNSGSVNPNGSTTVLENASLKLQFTPDSFSKIEKVIVDGVEIPECDSYTFENITSNHTVDVYFVPTAVINLKSDTGQNGSVSGHYEVIDGTLAYILNVTPDKGYETEGIYINGKPADPEKYGEGYIFRELSGDMEIDVHFKQSGVFQIETTVPAPVTTVTTEAVTTSSSASDSAAVTTVPAATTASDSALATTDQTSAVTTTNAVTTTLSNTTTTDKNNLKASPHTGDSGNPTPWKIILGLSALAMCSTTYYKKTKKADK